MSIRTKTITVLYYTSHSYYGTHTYSYTATVPIRDWGANPVIIAPPNWTIGTADPLPSNLTIIFPELSELEEYKTLYPGGFRFKLKKAFTGVDFVNVTGSALTGNVFNGVNLVQETVSVSFQNLDNLAVGLNSMDLLYCIIF